MTMTNINKGLRFLLVLLIFSFVFSCSEDDDIIDDGGEEPPPSSITFAKKEVRGVWMATVFELDWPQSVYDVNGQKEKYIDYLDKFVECNVNTVFVQIRPTADAFYNSPYESWSKSITGIAGKDPGYDVLGFMIEEAHKRDIEFHAWMNPYRIATRASSASSFPELDSKINSSWVKSFDRIRIYNPALPEVQQRIVDIVKDVISKYNVDGIHFDDYFYPDPSYYTSLDDNSEYTKYGSEYSSIEDFRRGNVDNVVKKIHEVIVAQNPGVVFSISPTSNREYNYNSLYADVTKWCKEGWIDVVIPQIYSATGSSTSSFDYRLNWWAQYKYNAALVVGHALYKFGDSSSGAEFQSSSEFIEQFKLTRAQSKVIGNVMYRAANFYDNKLGVIDLLKNDIYSTPAVRPFIGREIASAPSVPSSIVLAGDKLRWNADANLHTVIYKVEDNEGKVVAITSEAEYTLPVKGDYLLTTVNEDNLESDMSELITYSD